MINDLFKMKGQEASSWLNTVTRKMKIVNKILPDTVYKLRQARKEHFIYTFTLDKDETHIWGLQPWNYLLAWGGLKCSPGGRSKRGVQ